MKWDNDLLVHKSFFDYFQAKHPEITAIEMTRKNGKIYNEVTKYRYDVLLKVDKSKKSNNLESEYTESLNILRMRIK